MDVTVKGLFWLLEAFRGSNAARQFILIGGDAGVGHFHYRHDGPITEATPHMAYPGCYALSKVLEEVMLEQFGIQYGINHCCLRAPWIMEKDDFRYTLSFGDDVFGGPVWKTLVPEADARHYHQMGTVPLLLDADDRPLKRNFVHVDDLVEAIMAALDNPRAERQLFNVCMDRPVDYGEVADYLQANARARFDRHTQRIPLELDGQQQGEIQPRLAAAIRPRTSSSTRRGTTSGRPTTRARSGTRANHRPAGHAFSRRLEGMEGTKGPPLIATTGQRLTIRTLQVLMDRRRGSRNGAEAPHGHGKPGLRSGSLTSSSAG